MGNHPAQQQVQPSLNHEQQQIQPIQKGPLPPAAQGLCWGGFFLTWIWGIGNSTWIALLGLVPVVNMVIPFILLFKGREWAWQNKHWDSVEHFNKTQKTWSIFGIVLVGFFGGIMILGILAAIAVPNYQRFQNKAIQSEAKMSLISAYQAQKIYYSENGRYSNDINQLSLGKSSNVHYQIGFADSGGPIAQYCPNCYANEAGFQMAAVGNIDADETLDVWVIDQDKNFYHVVDDTVE